MGVKEREKTMRGGGGSICATDGSGGLDQWTSVARWHRLTPKWHKSDQNIFNENKNAIKGDWA